jgi:hypothetical protein
MKQKYRNHVFLIIRTYIQQHANFVGLGLVPRQGYRVQIHYRVEWLKGFWPLGNNNRSIFM